MKVTVRFFANLVDHVEKKDRIELDVEQNTNISQLMDILCGMFKIKEVLFEKNGGLREWVTIMKNGREIRYLSGMDTILEDNDQISIFPPVVGG